MRNRLTRLRMKLEEQRSLPMTERATGLEDAPLDSAVRYVERVRSLWLQRRTVAALWGMGVLAHRTVDSWPRSDLVASLIACKDEMERVLKGQQSPDSDVEGRRVRRTSGRRSCVAASERTLGQEAVPTQSQSW